MFDTELILLFMVRLHCNSQILNITNSSNAWLRFRPQSSLYKIIYFFDIGISIFFIFMLCYNSFCALVSYIMSRLGENVSKLFLNAKGLGIFFRTVT